MVFLEHQERLVERYPAGQDIRQPRSVADTEEAMLLRRPEVSVDDTNTLVILLAHRQSEVRRRETLAVAAAGARNQHDVHRAAAFAVDDPRAQRTILLGGDARRRHC